MSPCRVTCCWGRWAIIGRITGDSPFHDNSATTTHPEEQQRRIAFHSIPFHSVPFHGAHEEEQRRDVPADAERRLGVDHEPVRLVAERLVRVVKEARRAREVAVERREDRLVRHLREERRPCLLGPLLTFTLTLTLAFTFTFTLHQCSVTAQAAPSLAARAIVLLRCVTLHLHWDGDWDWDWDWQLHALLHCCVVALLHCCIVALLHFSCIRSMTLHSLSP